MFQSLISSGMVDTMSEAVAHVFDYKIYIYLAAILFATKFFSILFRKLGLPQVVGALVAGIVIGPAFMAMSNGSFGVPAGDPVIKAIAEIGVVLLMFSAGLETNLTEIKKNGVASVVITLLGVIVPFIGGFLVSWGMVGKFGAITNDNYVEFLFFGVLLTATSVGITVEALKELGKLKGKVGTSILSAAVLDDIIGIIILAIVIGLKPKPGVEATPIGELFLKMGIFFIGAIIIGIALHYLFKWLFGHFPVTRRLSIFALAVCFFFAWAAESLGIAAITGAFIAGMVLSNMGQTHYVERKIEINSYMIFSPVFFASIGIDMDLSGFNMDILVFSIVLTLIGLATKIIGCGLGARICGFTNRESMRVGYGMMARGEVGVIVASKGIENGIIAPSYMFAAILLVVVTSIATPIFLKLSYSKEAKPLYDFSDGIEPPLAQDDVVEENN